MPNQKQENEGNPRLLVAGIVSVKDKQALLDFLKGIKAIDYENKEVLLLDASKEPESMSVFEEIKGITFEKAAEKGSQAETIAFNRNRLAEAALKKGFGYLLLADLSQQLPGNAAKQLLSNGKKLCFGLCLKPVTLKISKGAEEFYLRTMNPMAAKTQGKKLSGLQLEEIFPSRLIKTDACFLGCVLIHKDVLKKVKFRSEREKEDFECFAEDCKKQGIEQWIDTGVVCKMQP
ncbi:MAG: hypothetical protein JW744_03610 [Candidatus Diapherotrites archaeon]|uniref:Uncharacterized protein n=1 Tax=Candidatus Iainarchaeum sp. TaxID=3101447 RepID=A0A938YY76_9ARCH|nr:hypothetical protein [Candidatus Diapherotrites archaeon]